jgi:NADH/NAD ratio-sensing transcriptional regulator Rex
MSDYKSLNEEQRKVWNAVLIGVGVGVVGTALIMWRVNTKHISLVKAYADSVDATNEVLTRILISEGKVINVALKAGETLADVTSIHPAIPIPTP